MNIAIIYGGNSGEHEVSLLSASSVVRNIGAEHRVYLIGAAKNGAWYLQDTAERTRLEKDEKAVLKIIEDEKQRIFVTPGGGREKALMTSGGFLPADVVFPVLHGTFGEDGTVQGLLETAGLPYVGGGVMASSVSMDKEKTKIIWEHAGLPVVPYKAVKKREWENTVEREKIILAAEKDFDYPLFVKPCRAGSSVGAGKAENRSALLKCMEEAFLWDNKVLIEKNIFAREIECSITGNEEITVYTPGEVIPSRDFYDYEAKYLDPKGANLKIPADIDENQRKTIRSIALQAYEALELKGLSRVDFFIDKNDKKIYLNEVNTIPGFTSISMFAKMCSASGLPYKDLIIMLLNLAIENFGEAKKLKTVL